MSAAIRNPVVPAPLSQWTTRLRRCVYTVDRVDGDVVHCTKSVQGLRGVTVELPLSRFSPGHRDALEPVGDGSVPPRAA